MNGVEHALQLLADDGGTIKMDNVSPTQSSGSSKRKSRPVKRIINEEEIDSPPVEAECTAGLPLDATEPILATIQQHLPLYANVDRYEEEGPLSEVLSTGSVDDNMEQNFTNADLLKKVAEVINMSQQFNGNNILQQAAAMKDLSFEPSVLNNGNGFLQSQMSPLFANVDNNYLSTERMLQAILTPSLNFSLGANALGNSSNSSPSNGMIATPLISPNSNFLASLMAATPSSTSNSVHSSTKKTDNRPPVVSQTLKATKRKLFTEDERARAEAANMNSEERIDMSDLEAFAQTFKKQRIKFGFTQGDVGVALGKRYGTDFSQTTISRFEALNLSFKNMCKLRPLLKEWLADVETAIEGGASITDLIERRISNPTAPIPTPTEATSENSCSPSPMVQNLFINRDQQVKRRRKRTNLDLNQRSSLDAYFAMNPRPDHDRMTEIANALELDRDVVRVWFCNRRQKMRRIDEPIEGEVATPSVSPLFPTLQHMSTLDQLKEAAKLAANQVANDDSDGTSGSPDAPSLSFDSNDM
ncbi:unnamed protein product [Caenorhabditis bovis]|uniref:POU domain protein n=1 Tax=Caenorhabditis bovis TaxID=2654633 RepID=A0A8S1EGT7_9PELO|nr:unnamed protein product [Caenorhabditis bovis]